MIDESDFENALVYLDEILEIDPKNINALNNKGGVLLSLGNYSNAITYFDYVLEINENNTQALNNKAISLYKQELYITSLRTFYKSLQTDSVNQITINNTKNVVDKLFWIDETERAYGTVSVHDKNGNLLSYSKINDIKIQAPLGYILLEELGNSTTVQYSAWYNTTQAFEYSTTIEVKTTQYIGRVEIWMHLGDFHMVVIELILNGLIVTPGDEVKYELIIAAPPF